LKVLRRRRFRIVLLVLVAILSAVTFAQSRQRRAAKSEDSSDWRPRVEKRAAELDRRMKERRIPEGFKRWMSYESGRLKYHLEKGIDPDSLTGPSFTRSFAGVGSVLLIPLLVAVIGADIVSTEFVEGTVTLLLTRPVARWKILLGKLLTMGLFIGLTLALAAVLSWGISGLAFGWKGWGAPMLTGFRSGGGSFDTSAVRVVPLWQDTVAAYGLAWFSALCVGAMTFLLSVLLRSTAAAMGTMMATLVGGTILSRVASDWDFAKWFFVTNLPLPDFYAGMPAPFAGMTLAFSAKVLGAWAAAAVALAFVVFVKRDVTN
ncbi:MAG TPA: ABC transporter permease, partial [Thermoanaerobaculia bacterium]|nr:ABC transporter permease [Thermoanaerobaculia bacterium]